ncbi:hypothetical protein [Pseudomonas ovata]|uniref:hypothetical protein n=1 Tax=Pseudomonas ovata TaxID=1839709 RepID=UPI000D690018|nr:hypothetical protein [Pseudomonas ovata]
MDKMLAGYSDEEKLAFINMYTEELNALTSQLKVDLSAIVAKSEADEIKRVAEEKTQQGLWGFALGALIIIGVAIYLFSKR